jgi:hypothetical protein
MRLDKFGGRQCHHGGEGHVADISGLEIERARLTGCAEHAHAGLTLDIILPFIGVGMPMQFSHPAGINFDQRRGDRGGNGKHAGVGDPYRSALGLDWLLRHHFMAEAPRHSGCGRIGGMQLSRHRGCEDVSFTGIRRVPEGRGRDPKILGQHLARDMFEPICDEKSVVFVKVAIVEYEKKFASVWIEPLDRSGIPAGKYHRSPTPTSSTKFRPCASTAVMRAVPYSI